MIVALCSFFLVRASIVPSVLLIEAETDMEEVAAPSLELSDRVLPSLA